MPVTCPQGFWANDPIPHRWFGFLLALYKCRVAQKQISAYYTTLSEDKSQCVCANTQGNIFLKRGKKSSNAREKKPRYTPGCTWPCQHLGATARGGSRAGPCRAALPALTSGCGGSSEWYRLERSLRFSHSRWIHSESKPSTWPAAPCAAFFVCLMILDRPFSLGSACIASPPRPAFYKCCHHPLSTRH